MERVVGLLLVLSSVAIWTLLIARASASEWRERLSTLTALPGFGWHRKPTLTESVKALRASSTSFRPFG